MGYMRPVDPSKGISSYWAHLHRSTPSTEPGVDYYCDRGTRLHAPESGYVRETDGGLDARTGRYVALQLDDGRLIRWLHLSSWGCDVGRRFAKGEAFGPLSGSSGYGSEFFGYDGLDDPQLWIDTGGPHVHMTVYRGFGDWVTIDPETLMTDTPVMGFAGFGIGGAEEEEMPKYVQVKDDRGNFAIVGPDGVGRVLSGAALRGAQKIARVANGGGADDADALPEVELSGEEWDSSTLAAFGAVNVSMRRPSPLQPGLDIPPDLNLGPGLAPAANIVPE